MSIEDQIAALIAEAAPLRCLPDEEAEARGLPGLVDIINSLRAEQAGGAPVTPAPEPPDMSLAAVALRKELADAPQSLPTRRLGRPRMNN